jgi:uncharacterized membrane protein YkvI
LSASPSYFKRFLLPGFAFKAVVIGGGYATGRELAEFFLPSGPWGGVFGMLVTLCCWSAVCAATFLFARVTRSYDYGAFFRCLLGPAWFLFDLAYACLLLIMLSVFGAAAGAIGSALFGWPADCRHARIGLGDCHRCRFRQRLRWSACSSTSLTCCTRSTPRS